MNVDLFRMTPAHRDEVAEWGLPAAPWRDFALGVPLVSPESSYYAAVEGGRVVGYFAFRHAPDVDPYWYVYDVYVPPMYRRRGYGRAILSRIYEMFPGRSLWGEVVAWNAPALRLYLDMGWTITETYWRQTDGWDDVTEPPFSDAPVEWQQRIGPHLRFEGGCWEYRAHDIFYWPVKFR